jgi:hypothetical protein
MITRRRAKQLGVAGDVDDDDQRLAHQAKKHKGAEETLDEVAIEVAEFQLAPHQHERLLRLVARKALRGCVFFAPFRFSTLWSCVNQSERGVACTWRQECVSGDGDCQREWGTRVPRRGRETLEASLGDPERCATRPVVVSTASPLL